MYAEEIHAQGCSKIEKLGSGAGYRRRSRAAGAGRPAEFKMVNDMGIHEMMNRWALKSVLSCWRSSNSQTLTSLETVKPGPNYH